jgi:hypothetical protein
VVLSLLTSLESDLVFSFTLSSFFLSSLVVIVKSKADASIASSFLDLSLSFSFSASFVSDFSSVFTEVFSSPKTVTFGIRSLTSFLSSTILVSFSGLASSFSDLL